MEDDGGAGRRRARGAGTHGEEEHRCRANAKRKDIAASHRVDGGAGRSSCGAGGSGVVNDRTTSTTVVTRSGNPIMEWLCSSMSGSMSTLDEYDEDDEDWTRPGSFLIEDLQMEVEEVAAFKRKLCFGRNGSKEGKARSEEEDFVDDNESNSSPPGSPVYAESGNSSSDNETDDDAAAGGEGSGATTTGGGVGASGSGSNGGTGVVGKPSSQQRKSTRKKKRPMNLTSVYEL